MPQPLQLKFFDGSAPRLAWRIVEPLRLARHRAAGGADCITFETRGPRRDIAAQPIPSKFNPETGGNRLVGFELGKRSLLEGVSLAAGAIQWRSSMNEQNPLWLIVGAMAIFFVAAAAILAAG